MPRKMTLERFAAKGRAAQEAVDAAVTEHTPTDTILAGETVDGVGVRITTPPGGEEYRYIPLGDITLSPTQPRDRARISGPKFEELVASVRENGVKTPIVVRYIPHLEGSPPLKYELVAGERRLLAAKEAGLPEIPAIIRQVTQGEAMIEQLIENLLRDDLDPIEEARGYQQVLALRSDHAGELETGRPLYTQESLARRLGKSQSHMAQRLGLLKLPETVQAQVAAGSRIRSEEARPLSPAHARELVPYSGYPWILDAIQAWIKNEGLPPAKEFPDFVHTVLFGNYRGPDMLVRPLSKGEFFGSGRHIEFGTENKGLPRDWSQLPDYAKQHPVAPGPGSCDKCPHMRVLKFSHYRRDQKEKPCCLLVQCWEGKQKAHRKALKERTATAQTKVARDTKKLSLDSLRGKQYQRLTKEPGGYSHFEPPFFSVATICKTKCPFKVEDGQPAYREVYQVVGGKVRDAGAVCLRPKHFQELQAQAVKEKVKAWKEGTVTRLKSLVKQTEKGLTGEDLVRITLMYLDNDLECGELGRERYEHRIAMTEFFQAVFGLKSLQQKDLVKATRPTLEKYAKFALEFHRQEGRGRR